MKKIAIWSHLKNEIGFTLAELVVASGLAGVILLAATSFFSDYQKKNKNVSSEILETINLTQFEQFLEKDISLAKLSLGSLNLKDDIRGNNFFDYFYDVSCVRSCEREIKLELPGAEGKYSKEMYFLIQDPFFDKEVILNPSEAYSTGGEFKGLNYNNNLNNKLLQENVDDEDQDIIWKQNALIYTYANLSVREKPSTPEKSPPVRYNYLGWVKNQNSKYLTIENIEEDIFINWDVRTMNYYSTEDDFLRNIPFIYGLSNTVYVARARIIRYRLEAYKEKGVLMAKLLRAVKLPDGKYKEFVIGDKIKEISFVRKDVSLPFIDVRYDVF